MKLALKLLGFALGLFLATLCVRAAVLEYNLSGVVSTNGAIAGNTGDVAGASIPAGGYLRRLAIEVPAGFSNGAFRLFDYDSTVRYVAPVTGTNAYSQITTVWWTNNTGASTANGPFLHGTLRLTWSNITFWTTNSVGVNAPVSSNIVFHILDER